MVAKKKISTETVVDKTKRIGWTKAWATPKQLTWMAKYVKLYVAELRGGKGQTEFWNTVTEDWVKEFGEFIEDDLPPDMRERNDRMDESQRRTFEKMWAAVSS